MNAVTGLLLAAIFVLGAALGGQLNRGIYRLAWRPRPIGPWSAPHPQAPPRQAADRLPIVGWLGLRRESFLHGPGYWLRPLLIELLTGAGFAALYWWEVCQARLLPAAAGPAFDPWLLHAQFLAHAILIALMIVATFIDFDEKTIPDAITLPGTLAGLILMAAWPAAAPPVLRLSPAGASLAPLLMTSPLDWPDWLNEPSGLGLGLTCLAGWCLAVWPKTATLRRGPVKGAQYLVVSMFRYPFWWLYLLVMLAGWTGIASVWAWGDGRWPALLTALVGMAFGGGFIWAVRIVGGGALGKEAMGFGDVTLMAMIGAFLGWQAALITFFLAPFVAIGICLVQWIVTRRRDIAFGPYLCTAAVMVILGWSPLWEQRARLFFQLGALIPQLLFFCLILMAGMLRLWHILERALIGRETP
jgi:prepilin signal peptidase PulO-like enzyme (type II secretory pathway)